jgi:hypothetical protein
MKRKGTKFLSLWFTPTLALPRRRGRELDGGFQKAKLIQLLKGGANDEKERRNNEL